ncbi:MAG: MobC family plasmid mobilization relaxosome protein [Clostridia bacterium]|nr:MobC family plasmid mobilization relaxosome protein [Clostridia bacterium]
MSTKTKSGKKETLNHILKARVTDREYYKVMTVCQQLKITPSRVIRAFLDQGGVHATVYENGVNDQTLTLLNQIITELKRIGNNINQIARVANTTGLDDPVLIENLNKALDDLTESKHELLEKASDAIGNHKAC